MIIIDYREVLRNSILIIVGFVFTLCTRYFLILSQEEPIMQRIIKLPVAVFEGMEPIFLILFIALIIHNKDKYFRSKLGFCLAMIVLGIAQIILYRTFVHYFSM